MQITSESGKPADGLWVTLSTHGDVQLAGTYINASRIRVQDRQCAHLLLPFLAICSSDHAGRMPGARTQSKLPIEIVVENRQTSSHVCTQPQTRSLASYEAALKPLNIQFFLLFKGEGDHPDLWGFGEGKRAIEFADCHVFPYPLRFSIVDRIAARSHT
jgi:hypothetical protein